MPSRIGITHHSLRHAPIRPSIRPYAACLPYFVRVFLQRVAAGRRGEGIQGSEHASTRGSSTSALRRSSQSPSACQQSLLGVLGGIACEAAAAHPPWSATCLRARNTLLPRCRKSLHRTSGTRRKPQPRGHVLLFEARPNRSGHS